MEITCNIYGRYTTVSMKYFVLLLAENMFFERQAVMFYSPATEYILQLKFLKVDFQSLAMLNRNIINAVHIFWVVLRISRTCQSIV